MLHHKVQDWLEHGAQGAVRHRFLDMGVHQHLGLCQQVFLHTLQQLSSIRVMEVKRGAVHIGVVRHIPDGNL